MAHGNLPIALARSDSCDKALCGQKYLVYVGIATALVISPLARLYLRHGPKALGLAPDGLPIDARVLAEKSEMCSPRKAIIRTSEFTTLTSNSCFGSC